MIFALVDFDVQVIGLRVAMKKHLGKQVFPDPQTDRMPNCHPEAGKQ